MQNHQIFVTSSQIHVSSASLVSMYNTHVYGYYRNTLREEKTDMKCLLMTLKGNARIIYNDGKEINLPEKSVFFGQISSLFTLASDCDHWHFICYWFIPHNVSIPFDEAFSIKSMNEFEENETANKIIRLLQTHSEDKIKYANSFFCYYLCDTLEKIDPFIQKSTELTDKIIQYINNRIEDNVKVEDIAADFHYSEKHIRSIFKNALGISPKQYINRVKMENICHLLLETNITLQELAEKYCFTSASHLVNAFKKEYGTTPTKFRTKTSRSLLPEF